jgi:hypothetical protein
MTAKGGRTERLQIIVDTDEPAGKDLRDVAGGIDLLLALR